MTSLIKNKSVIGASRGLDKMVSLLSSKPIKTAARNICNIVLFQYSMQLQFTCTDYRNQKNTYS